MDTTQDRQLIARLQGGDETAVQELADRYRPRIAQLAMRYMKNREDAEEVTQDVLMKVYRKVGAFRGDSALSSWITAHVHTPFPGCVPIARRSADVERDATGGRRRRTSSSANRVSGRLSDSLIKTSGTATARGGGCCHRGLPEIYRGPSSRESKVDDRRGAPG